MGNITTLSIPLFRFENEECFPKWLIFLSDLVHDVWGVLVHGRLPDPEVRGVQGHPGGDRRAGRQTHEPSRPLAGSRCKVITCLIDGLTQAAFLDIFATGLGYLGMIFMANPGFFQMLRYGIEVLKCPKRC